MDRIIWEYNDLERFLEIPDAEVRFWAVDRLIRHYPEKCSDLIADLLFDEHLAIPGLVARHLGQFGEARHQELLLKGFRVLRGATPGLCFQALARQGYPGITELAAATLEKSAFSEPALGMIVESLADLGSTEGRELIRRLVSTRVDLLADPQAMRGLLNVVDADELPRIVAGFFRALPPQSTHRADEAFRIWMDALQVDDASWCFRTGPSGRIELRKTIKALESNYDCDIQEAMGDQAIKRFQQNFRSGGLEEIVRGLSEWTIERTRAIGSDPEHDPEDPLARCIGATVHALSTPELLDEFRRLGNPYRQWLIGFHLSTAFAVARYRNVELQLSRARGNLDRLLTLGEVETAFLLPELSQAIAIVCKDDEEKTRSAQDWCLRTLESQGPFFPTVVALETLGELRTVPFIPEIIDYLSDENSYVFHAAERALGKMGDAIVGPLGTRLAADTLPGEAALSLLVLLCDLGSYGAYEVVAENLEWFMEEVGVGVTSEWVSLFGHADLIEPLRDWLELDPPMVGQGLLLLGAIHGVPIPEENEILQAIDDERKRMEKEGTEEPSVFDTEDGGWVM